MTRSVDIENLDETIAIFVESEYLEMYPDVRNGVLKKFFKNGLDHFKKYGFKEGRLPNKKNFISRRDKIFSGVDINGLGLEIGPSHNPVAPKKEGFNIKILDVENQENLRKKFADHGVNLENIEEVDYVWNGGLITDLVCDTSCFDYIIASHVIEHTPDLVTFLQECSKLLTKEGVLCLVIPDKRYCFDHFSPVTKTGDVLDAWVSKRIRPTPGQIFEYLATSVKNNGAIAWSEKRVLGDHFEFSTSFDEAANVFMNSINNQSYYDAHCWRFTLNAFKLLIADLNKLGLTNYAVHSEFETEGCEFYISLKNSSDPFQGNRLEFLKSRLRDC